MTQKGGAQLDRPVSRSLQENLETMRRELGESVDLIFREFTTGFRGTRKGLLLYIDGLAEGQTVKDLLSSAVTLANPPFSQPRAKQDPVLDFAEAVVLSIEQRTSQKLQDAVNAVLAGETALFLDGAEHVLLADTRWNPGRSVEEPATETEVRGPRDGLVENIRLNTVLLRKRIRDPRLRMEALQVGTRTQTDVVIAYIQGLAAKELVAEVRRRIKRVKVDSIVSAANLEEFLQDSPLTPFGALLATERPDRTVSAILEGRVAVLVDNTPFILIAPTTFWQSLQAPGDYYHHYTAGTTFRWVRFGALLLALTAPSLYTLLTTFHHEMIPSPLALNIAGGREGTPLPTLGEVLAMEVMFEVIHEAGLRLPRAVGQTVSIVGALVIGEAAVQAGLVAPATVIVIATAGITGFAIPFYGMSLAVRMIRFPLLLLSGFLGVFGFIMGTSILALHLASLRSFGTPYLAPMVPLQLPEQLDTLVRVPSWAKALRPRLWGTPRTRRVAKRQKPRPPEEGGSPS